MVVMGLESGLHCGSRWKSSLGVARGLCSGVACGLSSKRWVKARFVVIELGGSARDIIIKLEEGTLQRLCEEHGIARGGRVEAQVSSH